MTRLTRRNHGKGHSYLLDGTKVAGVTTVIGSLDKPALRQWYASQAAERAVNHWDELAERSLTERLEFIKYGPRDIVKAAGIRGTQIHALGEKLAHGEPVDVPDEHVGPVEAYARFLDEWQIETIAAETPLASTEHHYAGTADLWCRIGARDNEVALIDNKTSRGIYSETGLQLAAYRFTDLLQPQAGVEIATPEVSATYVAHILPDTVRLLPVVADRSVWRTFLYLLQVHRAVSEWSDAPLIGEALS